MKAHTTSKSAKSAATRYVAYYRVSTKGQGESGLGLEAQKACIAQFTHGAKPMKEFTEVESGKKDKRPRLLEAIDYARKANATLIIAKLDRLSRNVRFIFELRDSGVTFVACDLPQFDTLTIGIFATLAQHERELISQRTKAALAAKKARGEKLGNKENLTAEARAQGPRARTQYARENLANRRASELAQLYRNQGLTLTAIAEKLNEGGHLTRNGNRFHPTTVQRLLAM